jgi:hypothetical protein
MGTLADAEVIGLSSPGERKRLRRCRFCGSWEVHRQTNGIKRLIRAFGSPRTGARGATEASTLRFLRVLKPALPRSAAQLNLASKWLGLSRNSGRDFLTCAALLHNANLSRYLGVASFPWDRIAR